MRAALLARVSKEEQVQGYSLDAQRRAFRNLVRERNWTSYREYVEEGRSAHTDNVRKRPIFLEAIEDVGWNGARTVRSVYPDFMNPG